MTNRSSTIRAGFTLVELLVVVAVIALLIGVLLPALGKARAAGFALVSTNLQRQLAVGINSYASSNDNWIPGMNSSGMSISKAAANMSAQQQMDKNGDVPVQKYDWMTPALSGSDLPANRALRLRVLLDKFGDPAMKITSTVFSGTNDFWSGLVVLEAKKNGPYKGISFLMPATYQWYGKTENAADAQGQAVDGNNRPIFAYPSNFQGPVDPNKIPSYAPKLERLANQSRKICIATGFRYLPGSGVPDFDATADGGLYGSFTSGGACYVDSTEYGDFQSNNPSRGAQMPLSYRHNNQLVAAFWDGHASSISEEDSRDPTLWYPNGYVYNGVTAHPKCGNFYEVGDTIN